MCFPDDALPPHPPVRGDVGASAELVLTAADGNRFAASTASPAAPSTRGVVLLPDVRGLHPFFKALAGLFAEAGFDTVAMDWFGRSAGVEERDDAFDWKAHTPGVLPEHVDADVRACIDHLHGLGATSIITVGFCMGGAASWSQSSGNGDALAGCVGFYGIPARVEDRIASMRAPLLVLAAGQDFTPVADVEAFVGRVPVEAELHVYPDAPHSFFDRGFAEHREACEDAWRRILDFADRVAGS